MNNDNNTNKNNNLNNEFNNINVDSFFNPQIDNDNNNNNNNNSNNVVDNIGNESINQINSNVAEKDNPEIFNNTLNNNIGLNSSQVDNSVKTIVPNASTGINITNASSAGNVSSNLNDFNNAGASINSQDEQNNMVFNTGIGMNNQDITINNISALNGQDNVNIPNNDLNYDSVTDNNGTNVSQNINNISGNSMIDNNINGALNNQVTNTNTNIVSDVNNNIPNNNSNANNTVPKKKSNKALVIVLVIFIIVAIASAFVAYLIVTKNNSKTENDYENNNSNNITNTTTTSTSTDSTNTIENNGFIYTKKAGYNYEINDGYLFVYNNSSAFQFDILPVSFDLVYNKSNEIEAAVQEQGYLLTNKKTNAYDGKNVLSYEVAADGVNALYIIFSAPDTNYSVMTYAVSKDNTFNYNLVTEAFNLTDDLKNNGTTTYAKSSDKISVPSIGDKLTSILNE